MKTPRRRSRKISSAAPPITHPEHFYGFVGIALAWQALFLLVAHDPVRYRPAMVPAILEKLAFGGAAVALFAQGRLAVPTFAAGLVDLVLAALFAVAFLRTPARAVEATRGNLRAAGS